MLTLDETELACLRHDILDVIVRHAGALVPDNADEQAWLTAMLQVDAGLRKAMPLVTKTIEARALKADISQSAIARARGTSRQAVNGRVKAH